MLNCLKYAAVFKNSCCKVLISLSRHFSTDSTNSLREKYAEDINALLASNVEQPLHIAELVNFEGITYVYVYGSSEISIVWVV